MRGAEQGFLLLTSSLGDPDRRPLSTAQFRVLADRCSHMQRPDADAELEEKDLRALGYGPELSGRILKLLSQEEELEYYLRRGLRQECRPITRIGAGYPERLRERLGLDSPGVLWAMGDLSILAGPRISLVGSRELQSANAEFAREVGYQAAKQGYVLVSGNARGADRTAQQACLDAGGSVICVVPDQLSAQYRRENVLFISEDDYDAPFCAQRALSRNRVIHALGEKTFVAQCTYGRGGTWDGTVKNLRFGWSDVYCFGDGSAAALQLEQMGATLLWHDDLKNIPALYRKNTGFF